MPDPIHNALPLYQGRSHVHAEPAKEWFGPRHRRIVTTAAVLMLVGIIALKIASPRWYAILLTREDSLGEYLTAILYLGAAVLAAQIALIHRRLDHRLLGGAYIVLTLGLAFIAMEEISWGQRLFAIETPAALVVHNQQGEITVHNLTFFPLHMAYILVGLYGSLAALLIPDGLQRRHHEIVRAVVPDRSLFLFFFTVAALYLYYDYLSVPLVALFGDSIAWRGRGHFMDSEDQEAAELMLACGFLLFVAINRMRLSGVLPRRLP